MAAAVYLARVNLFGRPRYRLRRTVIGPAGAAPGYEELFDLGEDPRQYLHYPGGRCLLVDERVEDALRARGATVSSEELEDLFWPFVDREIRHYLEPIRHRHRPARRRRPPAAAELDAVHAFDKRRLFFLRCGRLQRADLCHITSKLYTALVGMGRDQLEQYFLAMESELHDSEVKRYVFAAFGLEARFPGIGSIRVFPETIDPDSLSTAFLDELCRLHQDSGFWGGMASGDRLHEYLARYVVLFFDYEFPSFSADEEFVRRFMGSRRQFRWPERKVRTDDGETAQLFGHSLAELRALSRSAFIRLYRSRAKELHPDKGGAHDSFVRLTAIYHELLREKAGRKKKG